MGEIFVDDVVSVRGDNAVFLGDQGTGPLDRHYGMLGGLAFHPLGTEGVKPYLTLQPGFSLASTDGESLVLAPVLTGAAGVAAEPNDDFYFYGEVRPLVGGFQLEGRSVGLSEVRVSAGLGLQFRGLLAQTPP